VLAALQREGEVLVESYEEQVTRVRARVDDAVLGRFGEFLVGDSADDRATANGTESDGPSRDGAGR
jgi:hypothetical protein